MSETFYVNTSGQDCSNVYNMSQITAVEIRIRSSDCDFKKAETEYCDDFLKTFHLLFAEKALLNIMWDFINPVSCWQLQISDRINKFSAPICMDEIPQIVKDIDSEYTYFLSIINTKISTNFIRTIVYDPDHTYMHIGTNLISVVHTKPIDYESDYYKFYDDERIFYSSQGWYAKFVFRYSWSY
jgi:hypothetical protein